MLRRMFVVSGRCGTLRCIETREVETGVFIVERNPKGISMEDLAEARKAAIATAGEMTSSGDEISYIRSTFAPEDGRCMCLFDGQSEEQVRAVNDIAGFPYDRVVPAMDLTP